MQKTLRKTIALLTLAVLLMFGFSFALVPLYRVACQKIGLNTSIPISNFPDAPVASSPSSESDLRTLMVQLITIKNQDLPWDFQAQTKMVQVRVGEKIKVLFYAKNNTNKRMTVQAIPSMTPAESISHFHKLECFCFNQQSLEAGEEKNMALVFQVDKDLPKDIHTITLAYTLFDVTSPVIKKRS